MSEDCKHYWIPKTDVNGNPIFRKNRHLSSKPLLNARCSKCNTRSWFTREQWQSIPASESE